MGGTGTSGGISFPWLLPAWQGELKLCLLSSVSHLLESVD